MPQVGVYDSDEVNAFATGPTKNRALVAVSTGLLRRLRRDEVEGVLGHEIAHVANGDMVTMTLVQGVVNAFAMFLARVLAFFVAQLFRRDEEGGGVSAPRLLRRDARLRHRLLDPRLDRRRLVLAAARVPRRRRRRAARRARTG